MPIKTILLDGTARTVKHWFSADRVLVDFDGLTVTADRNDLTGWELGAPVNAAERMAFEAAVGPDGTTVTVTVPDLPVDDIIPGDNDTGAPGGDPGGFV